MLREVKNIDGQHPVAYALQSGPFRTDQACKGKAAYYFLYEDGRFSDPDYNFFLQTQLLANKLLSGMNGYVFYVQIFIEAAYRVALEDIPALAHWKDKNDIEFLFRENLGSQSILQKFSFFARNLDAVSRNTAIVSERNLEGVTGIFADYYAIKPDILQNKVLCKSGFELIKDGAEIALISDDTHAVWTILREEKYPQNLLVENLGKFCEIYSTKLNIYI